MKKIKREALKKKIYKRDKTKYNKRSEQHKIYKIVNRANNPVYGISISTNIIEEFKLNGVYYSFKIIDCGKVFILESGCKLNEVKRDE